MLNKIKVLLDPILVTPGVIQLINRRGFLHSSKTIGGDLRDIHTYDSLCDLFTMRGIFEVIPRYPLAPIGSTKAMLKGNLEEPSLPSWWLDVKFSATTSLTKKESIIFMLENSPYIKEVVNGHS